MVPILVSVVAMQTCDVWNPVEMETLPDLVKRLRKAKGWTLEDLAEKSALVKGTITNLENGTAGRPRPSTLLAISGPLGVSFEHLLDVAQQTPTLDPPPKKRIVLMDDLAADVFSAAAGEGIDPVAFIRLLLSEWQAARSKNDSPKQKNAKAIKKMLEDEKAKDENKPPAPPKRGTGGKGRRDDNAA